MEFTEYLFRLEDFIEEWVKLMHLYNHSERPLDPAVERMHLEWADYRLEETCRDFATYLEDRRLGKGARSIGERS